MYCLQCRGSHNVYAEVCRAPKRKQPQGSRALYEIIFLYKVSLVAEAVKMYSQALAGAPKDATLWRNRSAAYSALGEHALALQDALQALQLNSTWPKGYYRWDSGSEMRMRPYGALLTSFQIFQCFTPHMLSELGSIAFPSGGESCSLNVVLKLEISGRVGCRY